MPLRGRLCRRAVTTEQYALIVMPVHGTTWSRSGVCMHVCVCGMQRMKQRVEQNETWRESEDVPSDQHQTLSGDPNNNSTRVSGIQPPEPTKKNNPYEHHRSHAYTHTHTHTHQSTQHTHVASTSLMPSLSNRRGGESDFPV